MHLLTAIYKAVILRLFWLFLPQQFPFFLRRYSQTRVAFLQRIPPSDSSPCR
jgi:hypothetical protein